MNSQPLKSAPLGTHWSQYCSVLFLQIKLIEEHEQHLNIAELCVQK